MTAVTRALGCLLLACAAACGGRSVDMLPDTDEGGSGPLAGSGGQVQGGSGGQGGSDGTGAVAGTAQGGATYGGSGFGGTGQGGSFGGTGYGGSTNWCTTQYADQNSWYVPVQIINKASKTIYVGQEMLGCQASEPPPFQVQNATGTLLVPPNICATTCSALLNDTGIGGCPAICWYPSAITLKPGEVFNTTWNGLFANQAWLPSECGFDVACQQSLHVQPGSYTFSSLAGLDLDCAQTGGEPCNICSPTPSGGCTTQSALIGGQRITAKTQVYLDASYGVWGDTGAAAGPTPNGNAGTAPQPRAVQLVFTE